MLTCDQCSNLLLDFVYDLLDEEETLQLRDHLADCAQCQERLTQAEDTQRLFGKAAQVYDNIPTFTGPDTLADETATEDTQELEAAPAKLEATSTAPSEQITAKTIHDNPNSSKTSLDRTKSSRKWIWSAVATAALVLLSFTGWSYVAYQDKLNAKKTAIRKLELSIARIDGEWNDYNQVYNKKLASLPKQIPQEELFLRLYGSQNYHISAPAVVRLDAQNLDGKRVPVQVSYNITKVDGTNLHAKTNEFSPDGSCLLKIPPNLNVKPNENLKLSVQARVPGTQAQASVEQSLLAKTPQFLSHLALNKSVYRTNDILFFRTLTLDRFRLTPPKKEFQFRYSILDSAGEVIQTLLSKSTKAGIGGGEFALTNQFKDGTYALLVEPITESGEVAKFMTPIRQPFVVRRKQKLLVAFRRPRFGVGDKIDIQVSVEKNFANNSGRAGKNQLPEQMPNPSGEKAKGPARGTNGPQTHFRQTPVLPQTVTAQLVLTQRGGSQLKTRLGTGGGSAAVPGAPIPPDFKPSVPPTPGLGVPNKVKGKNNHGRWGRDNQWPDPKFGPGGMRGVPGAEVLATSGQRFTLPPMQSSVTPNTPANFSLEVPKGVLVDEMEVKVKLCDGIQDPVVHQTVPLIPVAWSIEFFPEGGHLIQGVPNTVYTRITATEEYRRKPLLGKLVDQTGEVVSSVRLPPLPPTQDVFSRVGQFRFTPKAKQKYTLKVWPAGQHGKKPLSEVTLPSVRDKGVALTVANPADQENTPLRMKLFSPSPQDRIFLLATCRGHAVGQLLTTATPNGTQVELEPVQGTRGVVRLTAYRVNSTELTPVCERLVFRFPKTRLQFEASTQLADNLQPEQTSQQVNQVALRLRCQNEVGKIWSANALVGVTKEETSLTPESRETPDLPSYLYLLKDIDRPSDLDDSQLVASDTPTNRRRLNNLLAVQGWRQFVPRPGTSGDPEKNDRNAADNNFQEGQGQEPEPLLLYADNREQTKEAMQLSLAKKQKAIEFERKTKHQELVQTRDQAVLQLQTVRASLAEYTRRPQYLVTFAILGTLAVLIAVSLVYIFLGFYRLAQNHPKATKNLALACGLLFVSLVLNGSTTTLRTTRTGRLPKEQLAVANPRTLSLDAPLQRQRLPKFRLAPRLPVVSIERRTTELGKVRREPGNQSAAMNKAIEHQQRTLNNNPPLFVLSSAARSNYSAFEATTRNMLVETWFDRAKRRQEQDTQRARSKSGPGKDLKSPADATKKSGKSQKGKKEAKATGTKKNPIPTEQKDLPAGTVQFGRYVSRRFAWTAASPNEEMPDTLLWAPAVQLNNGKAELRFDIPKAPAMYRMIVIGNDDQGRFGYLEGIIQPGEHPNLVK
ncbi:MAG: anti-sigma factor family protein [Gemmataceae bacterium]